MTPMPADRFRTVDPVAAFRALGAARDDVFWLDAGTGAASGWSMLGCGVREDTGPDGIRLDTVPTDDILPPLRDGWVGWWDYESGAAAAGVPIAGSAGADGPAAAGPAWLRVTALLAIDHARERLWIGGEGADRDALDRALVAVTDPAPSAPVAAVAEARNTPDDYAALIARCRDAIRAGDAYQLCLTTAFTVPGAHDPVDAYLRLRASSPSHHGGFLRIGGRALVSATPEQFLHADGGALRTRPIKGTRPRGHDAESDAALAAELVASVKERAENVMIVDLMRNDLSRVCEAGSIRVDGLWQVESYPAVHQLVSTVSGRLAPGTTVADVRAAAFPAGSMTGAPKLSAMTILHGLERAPRGVYSGCFGYVDRRGVMDLAMVIRSVVIDAERAVVGAGGGITWRSIAEEEVAEVATKARAPLAALGAVLPGDWAER